MRRNIAACFIPLFFSGCVHSDSNMFEPSSEEINSSKKIEIKQENESIDLDKCRKLGSLQVNTLSSKGQPVVVVAVRKYKNATLIKFLGMRMDGGITGEAPFDFYDVYNCR